jgi:CHAT domain-containing protein
MLCSLTWGKLQKPPKTLRIQLDHVDSIEQLINACQKSLQICSRDTSPELWASLQVNLATAFSVRIWHDQKDNLNQALNSIQEALRVYTREAFPEQWAAVQETLASVLSTQNDLYNQNEPENLKQTINAYQACLTVYHPDTFPDACRRNAFKLGNLYFGCQWHEAANIYQQAIQASEYLYQNAILLDSKAAELAETGDLPRRMAYTLARSGNLEKAVETLEQGRARGLSESLDRDRANLTHLQQNHPDLHDRYQDLTQQLRNLEAQQRDRMTSRDRHSLTPEDLRETAIGLRQQLDGLIQEIRQVEGYEQFLTLPTFADVRQAATGDRPLVYLVSTPAGSLALVIGEKPSSPNPFSLGETGNRTNQPDLLLPSPSGRGAGGEGNNDCITAIWLDDLTETNLQELLKTWFSAYVNWIAALHKFNADRSAENRQVYQTAESNWHDAIATVTHQLWDPLMQPVIQHLQAHNFQQATLISTGYLSLLPLHAAWTEDPSAPTGRRYALDEIHFTYAANAKSLNAAQLIAERVQPDSILAIDNPSQDLPNSEREVQAAIAHFAQPMVLRHTEATLEAVQLKLPEATIVHFSCHGTANLTDPLNSGLLMSDGLLTLKDIFALNLADRGGIRLVVLSACETGLSGIENADEAISLPTGLLQAGVAAVIASLWSVSDLSTSLLLIKFYECWREQKHPPDRALRQAQIWLRDTTNREKLDYLKTGRYLAPEAAHFLRQQLLNLNADRGDRSYAPPFHWAAFSYTGL